MNKLTCDYIAIDTNVFEHLLNPQENTNNHIDTLLRTLTRDRVGLIVDAKKRIENEYKNRIEPMLKSTSDKNIQQLLLLRSWIVSQIGTRKRVSVPNNDLLMTAIKGVITEHEAIDRIIVYVAFQSDRILITNDRRHIIEGGSKEKSKRRETLLRNTRRHRPNKKSEILSSVEATDRLIVREQNNA